MSVPLFLFAVGQEWPHIPLGVCLSYEYLELGGIQTIYPSNIVSVSL